MFKNDLFTLAPTRETMKNTGMARSWLLLAAFALGAPTLAGGDAPTPLAQVEAASREDARRLREFERTLNGIRFRYFDAPPLRSRRELGMARVEQALRAEPDPRKYSIAWDVFSRVEEASRASLVDAFAAADEDAGWLMLGWLAVFEDSPLGDRATALLEARAERVRGLDGLREIAESGILSVHPLFAQRAGIMAVAVQLPGVVPAMIVGQIWPPDGRSQAGGTPDLIVVRQPLAPYLTFDDLLAPRALRTGSIEAEMAGSGIIEVDRRVFGGQFGRRGAYLPRDFSVPRYDRQKYFYRGGTHESLVALTTQLWGKPTDYLGWDVELWRRWYLEEFEPEMQRRASVVIPAPPIIPTP